MTTALRFPAPDRTLETWRTIARGFLSADLKTGPVASSPTRALDSVRAATWLPSGPLEEGGTCPGASTGCHRDPLTGKIICYAQRLEIARPALGRLVQDRADLWYSLDVGDRMTLASSILAETYAQQTQPRPNAKHAGLPIERPTLRLGAGGDLGTLEDGQAWAAALAWAATHPDLRTLRVWLYSRSYSLAGIDDPLGPLADGITAGTLPNLAAYLSTDPSMIDRTAAALEDRYAALPVAVLASSIEEGREILDTLRGPDRPREIICPTDRPTRPLPIASQRPGEPYARGTCTRCRACVDPQRGLERSQDVVFVRR